MKKGPQPRQPPADRPRAQARSIVRQLRREVRGLLRLRRREYRHRGRAVVRLCHGEAFKRDNFKDAVIRLVAQDHG